MSSERQSRLESIENRRSEVEARLAEVNGGAEHLHTPAPDELAAEGRSRAGFGDRVAAQLQMLQTLEREVHRLDSPGGPGGPGGTGVVESEETWNAGREDRQDAGRKDRQEQEEAPRAASARLRREEEGAEEDRLGEAGGEEEEDQPRVFQAMEERAKSVGEIAHFVSTLRSSSSGSRAGMPRDAPVPPSPLAKFAEGNFDPSPRANSGSSPKANSGRLRSGNSDSLKHELVRSNDASLEVTSNWQQATEQSQGHDTLATQLAALFKQRRESDLGSALAGSLPSTPGKTPLLTSPTTGNTFATFPPPSTSQFPAEGIHANGSKVSGVTARAALPLRPTFPDEASPRGSLRAVSTGNEPLVKNGQIIDGQIPHSLRPPQERATSSEHFSRQGSLLRTGSDPRGGGAARPKSPLVYAMLTGSLIKPKKELPFLDIDVMSLVGGSIERRPSAGSVGGGGREEEHGQVRAFGVVEKDSGKVFTTRFYGGKLALALALLEEQSTSIQGQEIDADDEFEDADESGDEGEENTGDNFRRLASRLFRGMKVPYWVSQFGLSRVSDAETAQRMQEEEETLDAENVDEDKLASYSGNKALVVRTLVLLVVSVTDLIFALGMHAWPQDITLFGDLSVLARDDVPAFSLVLVLVIVFYWFDLVVTLVSHDSGGGQIGKAFFTDPKLTVAGSLGSRIWRVVILALSSLVFFLLHFGDVYDLARFHATLHILRAVNSMSRLFHMKDEITQQLKVTVSQNKRRFVDRHQGFDLDLTYICDRVIAMSLPCVSDAVHRNDIDAVSRFFRSLHYGCFLVVNLCQHFEERGNGNYDSSVLFNQVQKIPCVDHNAPMMHQLLEYCERSTNWLNCHHNNVISVHCQGGKGRTGTFIVGLLLWVGRFNNPTEAVKYVQGRRADSRLGTIYQGVSSPSQLRMIGYLISVIYCKTCHATLANALLTKIVLRNFPRSVSKGGALSLIVEADYGLVYDYGKANGLEYEVDQHDCEELEDHDLYCNFEFVLNKPVLLDRDAVVRIYSFLPAEAAKFVPKSSGLVHDGAHELRYGRVSGKQVSFCAFHPGFHAEGPISFTREQIDKSHNNPEFPDSYSLNLSFLSGNSTGASKSRKSSHPNVVGRASSSIAREKRRKPLSGRLSREHSLAGGGGGGSSGGHSSPEDTRSQHGKPRRSGLAKEKSLQWTDGGSGDTSEGSWTSRRSRRSMRESGMDEKDDEDGERCPDRFGRKERASMQMTFLDDGVKTDWSIMLVRGRNALAQVVARECTEPLVFGREDLIYDFAPSERNIRRVYFITQGCVVHRRRDPTRIINNGESCDGIFLGAGECYGVVPFLFGSSFEKTDTVLRAWSNAVEVRYLELEDEETHPKDHSVLFKGLSELESAMVMRAIAIQVLREEQKVNALTAVANLRRVEKTNQHKERFRRGRSAIVADTMTKCHIPSSHALRYFEECRRRTSKGIFVGGHVLIFKYHFVFRPHTGAHDVLLDLRELSRVHSNGSMLQMLSVVQNESDRSMQQSLEAAAANSPMFRTRGSRGRHSRGSLINLEWGTRSLSPTVRKNNPRSSSVSVTSGNEDLLSVKHSLLSRFRALVLSVVARCWNLGGSTSQPPSAIKPSDHSEARARRNSVGSLENFANSVSSMRIAHPAVRQPRASALSANNSPLAGGDYESSTRDVTSAIEFDCRSISGCREMRSAIQSVADEISESRRLKIKESTSKDLEGGPFGADPSRHGGIGGQSQAEDCILMRLHQLCVDKVFHPGECIVNHGDTDREIYYIVSGAVNAEVGGKLVEKLTAGDVIGERGFFSTGNSGCRATAIAQSETECLIITPEVVKMLEQHEPKHAARVYRGLATAVAVRLYHALANVHALAQKN